MKNKPIWPGYVWMYFNILNELNLNYKKLNNLEGKKNNNKREKLYYEICEEITQIIPYKDENGKLILRKKEGILDLLDGEEPFIETFLSNLLLKEQEALGYIKNIRNYTEHKPHRLLLCAQTGTKGNSEITLNFLKKSKDYSNISGFDILFCYCDSEIIKRIIRELNELFRDIRKRIYELEKEGLIDNELARCYSRYRLSYYKK